ncbi:hypothetical protein Afil01_15140 [Actinorhabdospora filicis]|uniref:DUF3307 domain-containing protein n=1 Tax=Actinorhabdospora filicis TaxID=1785913 RepID=A0A9W6SIR0_9ACTN|nr:transcriptional regulator [Actinorhabdospora filicis]GLZ76707.1 hypothetical protein Afil01_15140 [Actinorhabdospora filicis]
MMNPVAFSVFAAVLYALHPVADYWMQGDHQAAHKADHNLHGHLMCGLHVVGYTLTCAIGVAIASTLFALPIHPGAAAAALVVNAGTHYLADRRTFLAWVAERVRHGVFWRNGGAPQLDRLSIWESYSPVPESSLPSLRQTSD